MWCHSITVQERPCMRETWSLRLCFWLRNLEGWCSLRQVPYKGNNMLQTPWEAQSQEAMHGIEQRHKISSWSSFIFKLTMVALLFYVSLCHQWSFQYSCSILERAKCGITIQCDRHSTTALMLLMVINKKEQLYIWWSIKYRHPTWNTSHF